MGYATWLKTYPTLSQTIVFYGLYFMVWFEDPNCVQFAGVHISILTQWSTLSLNLEEQSVKFDMC